MLSRLADRQPEDQLLDTVARLRNALWSELLDELNGIVSHLKLNPKPVPVQFRMADFASFALKVATLWGCRAEVERAFDKLEQAQAELVFNDEPIHQVLELWVHNPLNHGRIEDAGTLHQEWSALARTNQIVWPFENGKSLGQRLSQLRHALSQKFTVEVVTDLHTKQYRYRFSPKRGQEQGDAVLPPEGAR